MIEKYNIIITVYWHINNVEVISQYNVWYLEMRKVILFPLLDKGVPQFIFSYIFYKKFMSFHLVYSLLLLHFFLVTPHLSRNLPV